MTEEKSLYDQILEIFDENDNMVEHLRQVAKGVLTAAGFQPGVWQESGVNSRIKNISHGRVLASVEIQGTRWADNENTEGEYFPVFMVTENHVTVFSNRAGNANDYTFNFDHGDTVKIVKAMEDQILDYAKSGELVRKPEDAKKVRSVEEAIELADDLDRKIRDLKK